MDINVFSQNELPQVFRVLRTALSGGSLNADENLFLRTYSEITGHAFQEPPQLISPAEVQLFESHKAKRLVQLSAMAAFLSNPLKESSVQFVDQLAHHLQVKDPVVATLWAVLEGKKVKARILTMRRMANVILGEAYRREGFAGVIRFWIALLWRLRVNKDMVWRYKRLGLLPEGTLGREYWKHITELGFGFPGEPGGIPETVSYHDVSHVLNGYDTSPAGEIQQGSFQGGSRRESGFGFVQFVLLQFHHGIQCTPVAAPEVGYFKPDKVLRALYRGEKCNVDVTLGWDYWKLMDLPIAQARVACGL